MLNALRENVPRVGVHLDSLVMGKYLQNLAVKEIWINYYQQSSCPNGDASDPSL
jgi:hypothetical protein